MTEESRDDVREGSEGVDERWGFSLFLKDLSLDSIKTVKNTSAVHQLNYIRHCCGKNSKRSGSPLYFHLRTLGCISTTKISAVGLLKHSQSRGARISLNLAREH
jgi:hypothetical protein